MRNSSATASQSWFPPPRPRRPAETAYVTDSLRLGLYADADASGPPLQNRERNRTSRCSSGRRYARAHGAGSEGWVKSAYLVDEKPAQPAWPSSRPSSRLCAATRTRARRPRKRRGRAPSTRQAGPRRPAPRRTRSRTRSAGSRTRTRPTRRGSRAIAGACAPVGGRGAGRRARGRLRRGLWWLDALIRRRHGGFRVY